jgi:hypothetical protein
MNKTYEKILTKNDTGETGGHQAGIVVPKKDQDLLDFLPILNTKEFNPDSWIICIDPEGTPWKMRYIYYNGKTFTPAKSTRNEYRITYMTKFFLKWGAKSGDSVEFTSTDEANVYRIRIKSKEDAINSPLPLESRNPVVLRGWRPVF